MYRCPGTHALVYNPGYMMARVSLVIPTKWYCKKGGIGNDACRLGKRYYEGYTQRAIEKIHRRAYLMLSRQITLSTSN